MRQKLGDEKKQVFVSACCLGLHCRYHGRQSVIKKKIERLKEKYHLVPLCPEQLGGLPTPRPDVYWKDGKLLFKNKIRGSWVRIQQSLLIPSEKGEAYPFFRKGAEEVLRIAKLLQIEKAYFLKGSPTCDSKEGICANLLKENGIKVIEL